MNIQELEFIPLSLEEPLTKSIGLENLNKTLDRLILLRGYYAQGSELKPALAIMDDEENRENLELWIMEIMSLIKENAIQTFKNEKAKEISSSSSS